MDEPIDLLRENHGKIHSKIYKYMGVFLCDCFMRFDGTDIMGLSWDLIQIKSWDLMGEFLGKSMKHIEVLQAKSTILDLLMICIFSIKKPLLGESAGNMFTSKSKPWMMDDGSENGRLTPPKWPSIMFLV